MLYKTWLVRSVEVLMYSLSGFGFMLAIFMATDFIEYPLIWLTLLLLFLVDGFVVYKCYKFVEAQNERRQKRRQERRQRVEGLY